MRPALERRRACRVEGNLFRLRGGREIAIYVRDGAASVAEFWDGRGELHSPAGWIGLNGRKLVHAERRGETEIVSPIPVDVATRIEALHLHAARSGRSPAVRGLVHLVARIARYAKPPRRFFGRMPASSADAAV